MLKQERHEYILEEIRTYNRVRSSELSTQLKVSEDTIRRDLKELSDSGRIKKVHGGAMSSSYIPFSHKDREIYAHEEKVTIVRKAISLIKDDHVVLMDGGTTNLELARLLPTELKATVFTNSLPIAVQLAEHPNIEIVFIGGKVLKNAQVTIGLDVIDVLKRVQADLCIIGTRSININVGITEIDREEAQVKQALMNASNNVISLVISEKLDTTQPYHVEQISKVNTIVTELDPSHPRLIPYTNLGIRAL
ncbi:DeoR/GlpR family DNA-binding transcription regulator [Fulvivirgaceae bacterium BMA10]|uniref:DeoR/GlpR family DNA-binding transcription regulator n=1 Tax=Splendidivirga corallicola TaxID=3051826 RepID=A0ABT8KM31_9BACT|nr:DeoR/GlpR family DNA-binding transcription regulator [Fulvivirgaceae bacterium BMA10]